MSASSWGKKLQSVFNKSSGIFWITLFLVNYLHNFPAVLKLKLIYIIKDYIHNSKTEMDCASLYIFTWGFFFTRGILKLFLECDLWMLKSNVEIQSVTFINDNNHVHVIMCINIIAV